ncbi:TBC1 domain family member 15-like [Trematomus bernacchii]|uniref:TBC1 domain family member 15-like n=1 Tax=Trematomus bernacchii TaxID=40690 RepID=UPI00146CA103|nr:TBC1 domain family member 15-like [Trematomus bernacchii]
MINVPLLKQIIFKGGLCHAKRKEAWKFLLGYFPWESTVEERKVLHRAKTDEYFRMKLQWKSVSEQQQRRNSKLRDYRSLIEKDVNRTDRTNRFYEGLDNPGLVLLHDILMTYCMYDFDLGYVQGMSDLLSPVLYVMENEVDAFWCFVSFMDQMHQNFEEQMQGMKTQLIQLSTLLRLLDLSFWNYLEAQDSGYLYFCFRWLLIRFKRELSFQDVLRLWEVMWTGLPCQNFHLLLCCAILDSEKQKIMEENYGFNEILKHINELSMKLEIEEVLQKAEGIGLQIKSCKDLPATISSILGWDPPAPPPVPPPGPPAGSQDPPERSRLLQPTLQRQQCAERLLTGLHIINTASRRAGLSIPPQKKKSRTVYTTTEEEEQDCLYHHRRRRAGLSIPPQKKKGTTQKKKSRTVYTTTEEEEQDCLYHHRRRRRAGLSIPPQKKKKSRTVYTTTEEEEQDCLYHHRRRRAGLSIPPQKKSRM